MKSLCVFCGSSAGVPDVFFEAARSLGQIMAQNQIQLVYGGSNVGLMGTVADSVLEHGGRVVGILPRFLQQKEVAHAGLTELVICETMHERKTKMFELSQGFMALPGGFGTLEEVIEILTWQQLGLHTFPVAFLNVNGFFNHLRAFFDEMEDMKFLRPETKKMALFGDSVAEALEQMRAYRAPEVTQWIQKKSST